VAAGGKVRGAERRSARDDGGTEGGMRGEDPELAMYKTRLCSSSDSRTNRYINSGRRSEHTLRGFCMGAASTHLAGRPDVPDQLFVYLRKPTGKSRHHELAVHNVHSTALQTMF
jgi:hypothetical protein